jgi:cytoskeletal protein RodZ
MSSFIEIDGKKYHGISHAATEVGYSRDYISKLARDKKVLATQVGRQWYVELDSLKTYIDHISNESKNRQVQLREERRLERLAVVRRRQEAVRQRRMKKVSSLASHVVTATILLLGVGFGFALSGTIENHIRVAAGQPTTPLLAQLSTAVQKFPIATDTTVAPSETPHGVQFVDSEMSLATLDTATHGVLLLPSADATATTSPEALFSDNVKIITDETGKTYVARVKSNGDVDAPIPYVIVPVNHTTP